MLTPVINILPPLGRRVRRRFSPLTLRIMAVNMLALAILVGAILYLSRYQDRLIEVELEALSNEAEIFAGAIAEGATVQGDNEIDKLIPPLARQMVRRLDEVTDARTRLYDTNGILIADSWVIGRAASSRVEQDPLAELPRTTFWGNLSAAGSRVVQFLTPGRRHFQKYIERTAGGRPTRLEILAALDGNEGVQVYENSQGKLMFSVALPVQRYKQVLGVMNLTRDGEKVERAVAAVRSDILKLFALSLAITALLSGYLAQAIARPIRRLAIAADLVRNGQVGGRSSSAAKRSMIPDFTGRRDEIGELSGAMRSMTEALWQRMDAIESFAADVAHELKNPLASLRSAIETLPKIKDPSQQEKLLGIIQYDVVRLDRLITDISSASRLDAELSRVELDRIDVVKMLTTLVDLYSYQEGMQGRVILHDLKGPLFVAGLEARLVQVLQNLIDNAVSFSPELQGLRGTVRVNAVRQGGVIRITVEDDGPGIPEAKLEAIFDRFYTERPPEERFGQHSGLGLSISRQIIEAHRGRIYAQNRKGEDGQPTGAVFTIELPAA